MHMQMELLLMLFLKILFKFEEIVNFLCNLFKQISQINF